MSMATYQANRFENSSQSLSRSRSVSAHICEVDQCTPHEWAAILCQFEDATCDQSWAFGSDKWGEERLSHIVIRENGDVVAAAQLVLIVVPVINRGIAYLKMGPLWRPKGRQANPEALSLILEAIKQEFRDRRGLVVMALLPPDPDFGDIAEGVLHDQEFKIRRTFADPNRYLVNVTLDEEEQLRSMNQKWRYNLRKSLKNEFDISASDSEEALGQFMSLYEPMVQRKGFKETTPINALRQLFNELPREFRPQVIIVRHQGQPTAGAVVGKIGSKATYLFGATDDRALPVKAGYAMQWWIINWLSRKEGIRWYDLGGEAMEPGLRQFKKGLIGKAGQIVELQGEFETWSNPLSWLVAESGFELRSIVRGVKNIYPENLYNWFRR